MGVSSYFLGFGKVIENGGRMSVGQSELQGRTEGGRTGIMSAALAGSAMHSLILPRTIALIATTSLVAFALYATRPSSMQPAAHQTSHQAPIVNGVEPEVHADADTPGQAQPKSNSSASVTVNGKSIPVPEDGNLHQTITDGDTTTTVNLSSSSSGNGTNNSSTTINVDSSNSSSSGGGT